MRRAVVSIAEPDQEKLSKPELQSLADGLVLEEPLALERCVTFVIAETEGNWHGRARAMMCRRLKHAALSEAQSARLVACICERLEKGVFAEQFKDQLRLAMHLSAPRLFSVSRSCVASPLAHVSRYALWVLSHEQRE